MLFFESYYENNNHAEAVDDDNYVLNSFTSTISHPQAPWPLPVDKWGGTGAGTAGLCNNHILPRNGKPHTGPNVSASTNLPRPQLVLQEAPGHAVGDHVRLVPAHEHRRVAGDRTPLLPNILLLALRRRKGRCSPALDRWRNPRPF